VNRTNHPEAASMDVCMHGCVRVYMCVASDLEEHAEGADHGQAGVLDLGQGVVGVHAVVSEAQLDTHTHAQASSAASDLELIGGYAVRRDLRGQSPGLRGRSCPGPVA
jgi:hypothetical protein